MDSYVGPHHAPLPAPAAIAENINQRWGTSSISLSRRNVAKEGDMKKTHFPKGLAYIFHGTLQMSCLSSTNNSLGHLWKRGDMKGRDERAFVIYIWVFPFLLDGSFSLNSSFKGLPRGGFKCSFFLSEFRNYVQYMLVLLSSIGRAVHLIQFTLR